MFKEQQDTVITTSLLAGGQMLINNYCACGWELHLPFSIHLEVFVTLLSRNCHLKVRICDETVQRIC